MRNVVISRVYVIILKPKPLINTMNIALTTKKTRYIAAFIAFGYILVQCFQFYVLSVLPPASSSVDEFLQRAVPLDYWRATLLLVSFIGLMYVFLVICIQNLKRHFTATIFAFLGFFIFCFLEICIRSVELFYFHIDLATAYQQAGGINEQQAIMGQVTAFRDIQSALYFPLMLLQMIASAIIALIFDRGLRLNYLIIFAFALNALRLALRIVGMYLHIEWLNSAMFVAYLPCVILIFGAIGIWLLRTKNKKSIQKERVIL